MIRFGTVAAGLVLAAGATAFGFGFEGTFDEVAVAISGAVAESDPSALKIQGFIEKESDRLSKDFVTYAKVFKEARKGEFALLGEEALATELSDMTGRSDEFILDAVLRLNAAAAADPVHAARILKKGIKAFAKQAKFTVKYEEALDAGDLDKAALAYATIQRLFEGIDRAFPASE
jgi:hypothetical protein